jgi:hypothetical protein
MAVDRRRFHWNVPRTGGLLTKTIGNPDNPGGPESDTGRGLCGMDKGGQDPSFRRHS